MMPGAHPWHAAMAGRLRDLCPRRIIEAGDTSGLVLADPLRTDPPSTDPLLPERRRVRVGAGEIARLADDGSVFDVAVISATALRGAHDLADILRACVGLLAPGGAVFIGGLRHPRFAVDLSQSFVSPIEPEQFIAVRRDLSKVGAVELCVAWGQHPGETASSCYDAIVLTEPAAILTLADFPRLRWGSQVKGMRCLIDNIRQRHLARLRLTGVPNHHAAAHAFYDLAAHLGYHLSVTWSVDHDCDVDLLFQAVERDSGALPVDTHALPVAAPPVAASIRTGNPPPIVVGHREEDGSL